MSVIGDMKCTVRYAALSFLLAMLGLASEGGAVSSLAPAPAMPSVSIPVDTNGRDGVAPVQTERELRRELRRLGRDIRREERRAGRAGVGPRRAMAIASMVLGIAAFPLYFVPLAFVGYAGLGAAILAIILGAIAKRRAQREPEKYGGRRQAKAGFILGIIGVGILVVLFAVVLLLILSMGF